MCKKGHSESDISDFSGVIWIRKKLLPSFNFPGKSEEKYHKIFSHVQIIDKRINIFGKLEEYTCNLRMQNHLFCPQALRPGILSFAQNNKPR